MGPLLIGMVFCLLSSSVWAAATIDRYAEPGQNGAATAYGIGGLPDGRLALALTVRSGNEAPRYLIRAGNPDGGDFLNLDDFQLVPGAAAGAEAVTSGEGDALWSAGHAIDAEGVQKCVIRVSRDKGKSWQTDLVYPEGPGRAECYGLSSTASGLFATGIEAGPTEIADRWLILKKAPGRSTWRSVDPQPESQSGQSVAVAIVEGNHGELLAAGSTFGPSGARYGVIRRSDDGGEHWRNSMYFNASAGKSGGTQVFQIAVDAGGAVYSCGHSHAMDGHPEGFLVMRNFLPDDVWVPVLDLESKAQWGNCNGIAVSPEGLVIASGGLRQSVGGVDYRVLGSSDLGESWTPVDSMDTLSSGAGGIRAYWFRGTFYVTGGEKTAGGTVSFVRRIEEHEISAKAPPR